MGILESKLESNSSLTPAADMYASPAPNFRPEAELTSPARRKQRAAAAAAAAAMAAAAQKQHRYSGCGTGNGAAGATGAGAGGGGGGSGPPPAAAAAAAAAIGFDHALWSSSAASLSSSSIGSLSSNRYKKTDSFVTPHKAPNRRASLDSASIQRALQRDMMDAPPTATGAASADGPTHLRKRSGGGGLLDADNTIAVTPIAGAAKNKRKTLSPREIKRQAAIAAAAIHAAAAAARAPPTPQSMEADERERNQRSANKNKKSKLSPYSLAAEAAQLKATAAAAAAASPFSAALMIQSTAASSVAAAAGGNLFSGASPASTANLFSVHSTGVERGVALSNSTHKKLQELGLLDLDAKDAALFAQIEESMQAMRQSRAFAKIVVNGRRNKPKTILSKYQFRTEAERGVVSVTAAAAAATAAAATPKGKPAKTVSPKKTAKKRSKDEKRAAEAAAEAPTAPAAPDAPTAPDAPEAPAAPEAPPAPDAPASITSALRKPMITPSKAMKKFHWAPISSDQANDTLWKELDDGQIHIDARDFEATFCQKSNIPTATPAPTKANTGAAGDVPATPSAAAAAARQVKLIDAKRSYNIDISLARFRMSHDQIRSAILACDSTALSPTKLTALAKSCPTAEECQTVREYVSANSQPMNYMSSSSSSAAAAAASAPASVVASLGPVEQFFYAVSDVPNVKLRAELLSFRQSFDSVLTALENKMNTVEVACNEVRNSVHLRKILQIVLKLGNYMNGGTAGGGAFGYKLNALLKLRNTKSADNSITLLHYLVTYCQTVCPAALTISAELLHLKEAAAVESGVLTKEIADVSSKLALLAAELKVSNASATAGGAGAAAAVFGVPAGGGVKPSILKKTSAIAVLRSPDRSAFRTVMGAFHSSAAERVAALQTKLNHVTNATVQLAKYFGEDSMRWEELFGIFHGFDTDLRHAQTEIAAYKAKQTETERRKNFSASLQSKKPTGMAAAAPLAASTATGLMGPPAKREPTNATASAESVSKQLSFQTPIKSASAAAAAMDLTATPTNHASGMSTMAVDVVSSAAPAVAAAGGISIRKSPRNHASSSSSSSSIATTSVSIASSPAASTSASAYVPVSFHMSMNTLNANLMFSPPAPAAAAAAAKSSSTASDNILGESKRAGSNANANARAAGAGTGTAGSFMSPKRALRLSPAAVDPLTPKHSTITSGMAAFFGSMSFASPATTTTAAPAAAVANAATSAATKKRAAAAASIAPPSVGAATSVRRSLR